MLSRLLRVTAVAVLASLTLAPSASAQTSIFQAFLYGANEVPPSASKAFGISLFVYNFNSNTFELATAFAGLSAAPTGGHIHRGAAGTNGPIIFNFSAFLPAAGSGSSIPTNGTLSEADELELFMGNLYVNLHTPVYPAGEIRGQLVFAGGDIPGPGTVVPEPATLILIASGLAGLGMMMLRKRSSGPA